MPIFCLSKQNYLHIKIISIHYCRKNTFSLIHFIKFFKPYDLLLYGIFQKPEKSQVNGFLIIL
ncbi:MAG TPA: hypothetical protein DD657_08830 [Culturomica sp.]|nr:hypothetical protein [Culturomica sp.]